ncbi:hypothetical protein ACFE04_027039 [Oxalis oulophora]
MSSSSKGDFSALEIVRWIDVCRADILLLLQAPGENNIEETRPDLCDADMVIYIGDFNYRLFGITYDESRDFVSQICFDWLRERDQLQAEIKAGKVFQGMRGDNQDTIPGRKKGFLLGVTGSYIVTTEHLLWVNARSQTCSMQASCADCHVDRSVQRQAVGEIAKSNEQVKAILDELRNVPETTVSTDNISLQNQDTVVKITNKSGNDKAIFKMICEGQATVKEDDGDAADYCPRGTCGLPRWLEITPAAGVIKPDSYAEVSIHHKEFHTLEEFVDGIPQNWWCEDARDKEAVAQQRQQLIGLSSVHCFSAKEIRINSSPMVLGRTWEVRSTGLIIDKPSKFLRQFQVHWNSKGTNKKHRGSLEAIFLQVAAVYSLHSSASPGHGPGF